MKALFSISGRQTKNKAFFTFTIRYYKMGIMIILLMSSLIEEYVLNTDWAEINEVNIFFPDPRNQTSDPWLVEDFHDFYFLCCPECAYKSKDDEAFIDHAVENHPKSKASTIFSEAEEELTKQTQEREHVQELKKVVSAPENVENVKKVVKVINFPKTVASIDIPEAGVAEENQLVEMEALEDLDDFEAVESSKDEYIDGKLMDFFLQLWISKERASSNFASQSC